MNKKQYLQLIASFMITLILTIPFYVSDVIATIDKNNPLSGSSNKEKSLEYITGAVTTTSSLSAGEACVDKAKKTHELVESLDNNIIKTLEKIASILHSISTAWLLFRAIIDPIILIKWESKFMAGVAKKLEIARDKIGIVMNPIVLLTGCVICNEKVTGKIGKTAEEVMEKTKLSPYQNIYVAIGCFCPVAILFNMRKLKTIYQTYDCCVKEACTNGLSTEPCEKQLSEATCMYWEGSVVLMFLRAIAALLLGYVMKYLIENYLKTIVPYAGTIYDMAQIPFSFMGLQDAIKWMGRSFSDPNCADLGFDKIKEEEIKRQYILPTFRDSAKRDEWFKKLTKDPEYSKWDYTYEYQDLDMIENQKTYDLTWQLLNLLLGEFAYEEVSKICEEDWATSDPPSSTPTITNPRTQNPLTQNQTEDCPQPFTTLTAQSTKSTIVAGYQYDVSWTIAPCKEDIQYTVYLANTIDDKVGIAYGTANKGETKAETKQFKYGTDYANVCIQVSDTSIGNNGYACFSVVI